MSKIIKVQEPAERLDIYLSQILEDYSRSQIKRLLLSDKIRWNGQVPKASQKLAVGDIIELDLSDELLGPYRPQAEAIPLDVIYEDEDILIVNKARGIVVHPAPGHYSGTLVNALLHHADHNLSQAGGPYRPGIIHRLDRDTSGLLAVAKNDRMHRAMAQLWKTRSIKRQYLALVWGVPHHQKGIIEAPLGRSPRDRKKMAVVAGGKPACTIYRVLETYRHGAELALDLVSGRTHQIRVHLHYIGHPVIGDQVYAGKMDSLGIAGQALHAFRLTFRDPRNGQDRDFRAEPPEDYARVKKTLLQML